jgi:uncharacterized membrane protein YesL
VLLLALALICWFKFFVHYPVRYVQLMQHVKIQTQVHVSNMLMLAIVGFIHQCKFTVHYPAMFVLFQCNN